MTTAAGRERTERAYAERASEYVSLLGTIDQMDPLDACVIGTWSDGVTGRVLDAGCGPGHWSEFLHLRGSTVHGVDAVPQFVESARSRFPAVTFEVGDLLDLPFEDSTFGGVLAWYSLIHMEAAQWTRAFEEFARVTTDDGHLLIGAFLGPHGEAFDHAVTQAFYQGVEDLVSQAEVAGFQAVTTHTRTSLAGRPRPHLAVAACKSPSGRVGSW